MSLQTRAYSIRLLHKYSECISVNAPVCLAAEVLELAENTARDKKSRIICCHLQLAVHKELAGSCLELLLNRMASYPNSRLCFWQKKKKKKKKKR